MRWLRGHALGIFSALVLIYLFLPLAVIVIFSFNDPPGRSNISWGRFTLDNWKHPFKRADYTAALGTSLKIAFISCLVATVMGALMALSLSKYRFRGSSIVNVLLVLPLTIPEVVMGSSLFTLFFGRSFLDFGAVTIILAHITFSVSFVALTVRARVRGFDWTLEDAAMDLGAAPLRVFRTVTFPLILPGILAAFLLSMALSIDDYIITSFVAGSSTVTFPMRIFNAAKAEIPPQVHVLATVILLSCTLLMGIGALRQSRVGRA